MSGTRTRYAISLFGCDAVNVVVVELTDVEAAAVKRVAQALTKSSTYSCEPTMVVDAQ